jgi:hypothetical protein
VDEGQIAERHRLLGQKEEEIAFLKKTASRKELPNAAVTLSKSGGRSKSK